LLKVAILGFGVVGSGTAEMLIKNHDVIERSAGCPVRLTHVVDVRDVAVPDGVILTRRFEDALESGSDIIVETIGGTGAAYEYTRRALEARRHVVTSNKELVAERGDELNLIARKHGVMYMYEASVGGGIPILRPISQCLSGNRITRIDGIVNGSTNYLLTRMERSGVSFDEALSEARELGYAEADPRADIDGWDARRKLAILANAAFGSKLADEAQIETMGITHLTAGDFAAAAAFGASVKLIAHAEREGDRWYGWVHPAAVIYGSPLSGVSMAFNAIRVHGDFSGDIMFYGQGAGAHPTASAVIGDIIDVARHMERPYWLAAEREAPAYTPGSRLPVNAMFRVSGNVQMMEGISGCLPRNCQTRAIKNGDIAVLTSCVNQDELGLILDNLNKKGLKVGQIMRVIE